MMFQNVTPESVGVPSGAVLNLLTEIKKKNYAFHSLVLARGNKIFTEVYWAPTKAEQNHRMYSQTKSYVGIAVGQLIAEGKLKAEDKIVDYFRDKLPEKVHPYLAEQTVEQMLTMHTSMPGMRWFMQGTRDREAFYFHYEPERLPGANFSYDSTGSFILGALVERITGKTFLDYLKEKCFNEMGSFQNAKVLFCPGGKAWADSALLCTTRDMLSFARLLAQKGEWNGKQLLDRAMVEKATSPLVDNGAFSRERMSQQGYGWQIWGMFDQGFSFHGMHGQFTFYHAPTDITFTMTAALDRNVGYAEIFTDLMMQMVLNRVGEPLPPSEDAAKIVEWAENAKMVAAVGEASSALEQKINGKTFKMNDNKMGWKEFRLEFKPEGGALYYENAQGKKELAFGRCENAFQPFPQTGYSNEIGDQECPGHRYDCAVSAAWRTPQKLSMLVQIIDEYIGILYMTFTFMGDRVSVKMERSAEYFLMEYEGYANGQME